VGVGKTWERFKREQVVTMGGGGATGFPKRKLMPPSPARVVSRPRLEAQLTKAAQAGKLVMIVAPGGSGKSSLVARWAAEHPNPVAWYGLDDADGDPRRLVEGICAAIARVLPAEAAPAGAALAGGASEAAVLGLLLEQLENRDLVLVLDDFQHIGGFGGIESLWDHVFRFRPPSLTIILLSRTVPALGFSALIDADAILGLGHAELGFSQEEAGRLLAPLGVSTEEAATYRERCGGWATGLLLLARTTGDGPAVLRSAEQMLGQIGPTLLRPLSSAVRQFLLESAVLGPVTAEEAARILHREDAPRLFAEARAQSFFLNFDGETYRYHDLFAEFLRSTLALEDPAGLQALQQRAARYWVEQGDVPRALTLLADARAWQLLAEALTEARRDLWNSGLWATALRYIEMLPPALQTTNLLTLAGFARLQRGEHAAALGAAERGMREATTDEEWLPPALLHMQSLYRAGRLDDAMTSADETLARARRTGASTAEVMVLEVRGHNLFSLGQHDAGQADLRAALHYYRDNGDAGGEARTAYNLAEALIEAGRLADAGLHLDTAARLWHQQGNALMTIYVAELRAHLHVLEGDLQAAEREARWALAAAENAGQAMVVANVSATLAEVLVDAGCAEEAGRHAEEALLRADRLHMPDTWNRAQRAAISVALAKRDRARARALLDEALPRAVTPIDQALLVFAEGQLALRAGSFALAAQTLRTAAQDLLVVRRPHVAARAWLLAAEAYLARETVGKAEEALDQLSRCLDARIYPYLRPTMRLARRVEARYRLMRRMREPTRAVLDQLLDRAPAPAALRVSPYEQGSLSLDEREVDLVLALPQRSREVFFYVALSMGQARSEQVVDAVWPDSGRDGLHHLWEAGRNLRRLLGKDSWQVRSGICMLTRPLLSTEDEVAACALACQQDREPQEVIAMASRGLEMIGDDRYLDWCENPWVDSARLRTAREGMSMALALSRAHSMLGESEAALEAGRKAARFDRYDERPQRAMLEILHGQGHHEEARQVYRAFSRLLSSELGLRPSPELARAAGLSLK